MKMIKLDPALGQEPDCDFYAYDLEYMLNDRVIVFGDVDIPQFVWDQGRPLGCFQFSSDDAFYIFFLMRDEESAFLAHCTGVTENKDFVLNRFG